MLRIPIHSSAHIIEKRSQRLTSYPPNLLFKIRNFQFRSENVEQGQLITVQGQSPQVLDLSPMKKVVIITDGDYLRAFRLEISPCDCSCEFSASEIDVQDRERKAPSSDLIAEALFGDSEPRQGGRCARRDRGSTLQPCLNRRVQPGTAALRIIGRRIEEIVNENHPDLWNLVAPEDICGELYSLLDSELKRRMTCVQMADLLAITTGQLEEHFRSAGFDHL
ncbi:MAG: hypothetical protein ACC644_05265 [Candidatus Hydrothermarchaeales archaeon]